MEGTMGKQMELIEDVIKVELKCEKYKEIIENLCREWGMANPQDVITSLLDDAILMNYVSSRERSVSSEAEKPETGEHVSSSPQTPHLFQVIFSFFKNISLNSKNQLCLKGVWGEQDSAAGRRKLLPVEWMKFADESRIPSQDILAISMRYGFDEEKTVQIFQDFCYHYAKTGKKFASWSASWRSWVKKERQMVDTKLRNMPEGEKWRWEGKVYDNHDDFMKAKRVTLERKLAGGE
jgi:hypothetical protein